MRCTGPSELRASCFIRVDLPQPGPLLMRYSCISGSCPSSWKYPRNPAGVVVPRKKSTGGQGLQGVGSRGVQDGGVLVAKDYAVQAVGVAGAVDALDRPCRELGQLLHHGGLAAARAAFDEIQLHPGLLPQLPEIPLKTGGGGGAEKEIDGLRTLYFHSRTPRFWHKVCKSGAECHKNACRRGKAGRNAGRMPGAPAAAQAMERRILPQRGLTARLGRCAGTLRGSCPAGPQNPRRQPACSGAGAAGPQGGRCP